MSKFNPPTVSTALLQEILESLRQVDGYGSIEIYIQDQVVTQITVRNIKKTHSRVSEVKSGVKKTLDKPISLY